MGGFQGYEDQKKEWYGLGAVLELSSVRCHPARFAANLYPTYRKPFDLISMLVPHYTEGPIQVDLQPKVGNLRDLVFHRIGSNWVQHRLKRSHIRRNLLTKFA